eukprot:GHVU01117688.1.p1 GENE.GHVU01117688.1~~GHVU01117688.1.p1  ORF type:complete len:100 (-),score=0.70 GHVU01117688.1:110-409(-)
MSLLLPPVCLLGPLVTVGQLLATALVVLICHAHTVVRLTEPRAGFAPHQSRRRNSLRRSFIHSFGFNSLVLPLSITREVGDCSVVVVGIDGHCFRAVWP